MIDTKAFVHDPEAFEIKISLVEIEGDLTGCFWVNYRVHVPVKGVMDFYPGAEIIDTLQSPDAPVLRRMPRGELDLPYHGE